MLINEYAYVAERLYKERLTRQERTNSIQRAVNEIITEYKAQLRAERKSRR